MRAWRPSHEREHAATVAGEHSASSLTAATRVLALQSSAGNAAVARLLSRQGRTQPWDARVRAARGHPRGSSARARAYHALVIEALHVGPYDVWVAPPYAPLPLLNLDPGMEGADGRVLTPTRETPRLGPDASSPPPRELCVILGPGAVIEDSPAYTDQVRAHEMTHVAHFRRGVELWDEWLAAGHPATFTAWLERQHRRGRVNEADLRTTREMARGQLLTTELLAPLEAFVGHYHQLPVGAGHEESLHQLTLVARNFGASDDPVSLDALRRIVAYAAGLDASHRAALDQLVQARAAATPPLESPAFWWGLRDALGGRQPGRRTSRAHGAARPSPGRAAGPRRRRSRSR